MVRWPGVVAVLVLAPMLAGCSGSDDSSSPKTVAPTPITKLDTASVRVARAEFCDQVPGSAVRRALGGEADSDRSWSNGDPVPGGSGSGDVGHEIGCSWAGAGGAEAGAWVFARPVDTAFAGTLVDQAAHTPGCTAEATPTFGSPAFLQTCTRPDGTTRIRRAGLFGDSWLTCELTGASGPDLRTRTDTWCASVVAALDVS